MAVLEPYKGGYYLWKYLPSIEAAAIVSVLWFLVTAAHVWKIWKTGARFSIPYAVGGFSTSNFVPSSKPFKPRVLLTMSPFHFS